MKRKYYILIGIGLVLLGTLMYRNYTYMKANRKDYPSTYTRYKTYKSKPRTNVEAEVEATENNSNESKVGQKVEGFPILIPIKSFSNRLENEEYKNNSLAYLKFSSPDYDTYKQMKLLTNVKKRTTHTLDLVNETVTMNVPLESGSYQTFQFKIKVVPQDVQGLVQCNVVSHPEIDKIYISQISGAITYEWKNGYSLEFYDVSKL